MTTVCLGHHSLLRGQAQAIRCRLTASQKLLFSPPRRSLSCRAREPLPSCSANVRLTRGGAIVVRAASSSSVLVETPTSDDACIFKETFPITRTENVEGKIFLKLEEGKDKGNWQLTVGCSLPGKWILHWGVSYVDDIGSEWDQPPESMRPPGSAPVKNYAIETPLTKSSEVDVFHEVKIDIDSESEIAAISFVLKDEESGAWYQHKGRDFKVLLVDYLNDDDNAVGGINNRPEPSSQDQDGIGESKESKKQKGQLEGFYEEQPMTKLVSVANSVTVTVERCLKTSKNLLHLQTDLPGGVVVYWGVCRDESRNWEVPVGPYPPETSVFKNKALRTLLQGKEGENVRSVEFTVEDNAAGFLFVLKLNESTWLRCNGNDFFIPLSSSLSTQSDSENPGSTTRSEKEESSAAYTDGIINEIRHLISSISTEKSQITKTKEVQEGILREIEKLAAEAYSTFRTSVPTFSEETLLVSEECVESPIKVCSGTGTGFEILLQGFNWESHKTGRWYVELKEKAADIYSLGFTVIWLPPPTESVSPEGYMPRDLYNLNSRYGSMDELKDLVKALRSKGIKTLGDVVLNHRCAHYKNGNGIWNIFGGRLNWDDRAVVADDPHFQGRGNTSSGDIYHAAPNIDHSQEFVRNDIKEWLNWLREEIGYDGWRLDFVRGFWGGYVKDYLDSSKPYFAVGEYWDSLRYTYDEMDYNQDSHRQRIVDWISATGGTAGAFDVTTKGILHAVLERCEYWRLTDAKGKPPGVVGWWPSRAITFIENHDTGSSQGHWRFPDGKEMQGYAYILTHSGTPAVFYDHICSHYRSEIASLIALRKRNKINCRSTVNITKAERDVYAAIVDDRVAVKIGPGHYEPPSGDQNWCLALEGRDYKVWEAS